VPAIPIRLNGSVCDRSLFVHGTSGDPGKERPRIQEWLLPLGSRDGFTGLDIYSRDSRQAQITLRAWMHASCVTPLAPLASPLVNCSACRAVVYCGPRCQRAHWRVHKGECKEAAKVRFESALAAAQSGGQSCPIRRWCLLCITGTGLPRTQSRRYTWYRRAAEAGHAGAQFNLGVCYSNGDGVAKDAEQAASWFRRAAEAGHADAQFNLGCCYANGDGVAKDAEQAVSWYRRAAEAGYATAQFNLGICYSYGRRGCQGSQSRQHRGTAVQQRQATQMLSSTWACATLKATGLPRMQSRLCRGSAVQQRRATLYAQFTWVYRYSYWVKGSPRMQSRQCCGTAVQLRRATQMPSSTWAMLYYKGERGCQGCRAGGVVVPPCS